MNEVKPIITTKKNVYVIRQVRFPAKVYRDIAEKANALGLPVSTFIRLAAARVAGSASAKETLRQYEERIAAFLGE